MTALAGDGNTQLPASSAKSQIMMKQQSNLPE
jgi:hypothetical protein